MGSKKTEVWKAAVGFEGRYEVSSHGRVRRIASQGVDGRQWKEQVLSPEVQWTGYQRVTLYRAGRRERRMVHRLMLEAFVGPCPGEGYEACHCDNSRRDHIDNLRWDTRRENWLDRVRNGGAKNIGEGCKTAKLTNAQVREIRRLLRQGVRQRTIASQFGISSAMVSFIATGRAWRYVT